MKGYQKIYDDEVEYNQGIDDALDGERCKSTSIDYVNGYRKGLDLAAINGVPYESNAIC